MLTGVTRPDGTGVSFGYGDWAIVNKVQELSKTGNVRYSTSLNFPAAGAGALLFNPTYTQQTAFDGVNSETWNFLSTMNSTTGLVTSMAITDPVGTTSATTFSAKGDWADGLPTTEVVCALGSPPMAPTLLPTCQSGAGTTVLRASNKIWTSDTGTGFNPRAANVTTILEDGQTQSAVVFNGYDSNGNVTDLLEYDFGSGAHGPLLRETVTAYAALANNILDRPGDVQVKDVNGTVLFHEKFGYDEGIPTAVTASLPGRDPGFSASTRGNLTSTVVYANASAGTGSITSTFTYDSLGNLLISQSGCCTFTQRNFSSATQYAHPDSVATGPTGNQLTTSFTYNMATGAVATVTDPNGQRATRTYDVDNRLKTAQSPDGVTLTNVYDDNGAFPSVTTSNTANSLVTETIVDGRGRTLTQQALNGVSPVSTRSFNYDAAGRLSQASNPYGADAPVYTTYQYDGLGRVTATTPPAQNVNTGQNSYAASYSLATVTYTDPAGKQRKQYRDALGRLIRVDEPGLINGQAASGSATISGAEKSVPTSSGNGATAGTASVTMNGSERSTSVLTHPATHAIGTVTISGDEVFTTIDPCNNPDIIAPPDGGFSCPRDIWDSGAIWITANGRTYTVAYGRSDTSATIAFGLAGVINGDASAAVTAAVSGTTLTLTSKATGTSTNYSLSAGSATNDPTDFGFASFGPGTSGATLTGGTNDGYTTMYDTGNVTVNVSISGTVYSQSSSFGQNSSPTSIAADLARKINSNTTLNKLLIANSSASALSLTTTATGASTNYPLSVTAITDSGFFAVGSSSFTATPSGSAFTPGQNGTLYDSGTINATLIGFSETPVVESATFGQGSTPASIATSLAAAFHNDPYSPVDASTASGSATIAFTARTQGTDANNYSISIAEQSSYVSYFPTPSFASASVQLAGGVTPTPSLDPSVVLTTTYSYDAMGNLLQSTQGQQTRTYQYDGLGRVISSVIPETGYQAATVSYTDFGAPLQLVDSRVLPGTNTHITTTFTYDSLNRPKTVSYNDGTPNVTYTYNPPGSANNTGARLAGVANGVASTTYQYDIMGRPTVCKKSISGQTYQLSYTYHTDGTPASITYPSGRIVRTNEDAIARFSGMENNGTTILSIGSYNAAGEILSETYGNGVTGTYTYNNQLQLSSLQYAGTADILHLTYNYGGAQDNGRIQGITDGSVAARSTSYVYDELGRLKVAQTTDIVSPNTWKLQYSYDRYGNRLNEVPVAGTASMPMNEVLIDPTTNHVVSAGYAYDAAGNMTSDGLYNYGFDAAGQMTSVTPVGSSTATANFGYDANGHRALKNGTVYIYSGSKVIAEYPSGGPATAPTTEHIYRGRLRLATITAGGIIYHYADHLSVRTDTDSNGYVIRSYGSYPFGGTWYETPTSDKWRFTTYENDIESGLNYAGARFQSPRVGRFMSLDPVPGHLRNPQSLSRYAYVNNDPINLVDPTGMEADCGNAFVDCGGNYAELQDGGLDVPQSEGGDGPPSINFSINDGVLGDQQLADVRTLMDAGLGVDVALWLVGAPETGLGNMLQLGDQFSASTSTDGLDTFSIGGGGLILGGSANIGEGMGLAGTLSGAVGFFRDTGFGAFGTFGALAGGANDGWAYPGNPEHGVNGTYGAYAGIGRGFFLTNGRSSTDLSGPFDTTIFSTPLIEFQMATSGQVWQMSFTFGPGVIFGFSRYTTNTWVAPNTLPTHQETDPFFEDHNFFDPRNWGWQD